MYKLNKYYNQDLLNLKKSISCFNSLEFRFIESFILNYKSFCFLDFGFRYVIKTKNFSNLNTRLFIKNFRFVRFLSCTFFNHIKLCYNISYYNKWFFLKKIFQCDCFVLGRFLNSVIKGFSIGVCGLVSFISKNDFLFCTCSLVSVFVIRNLDFLSKKIYLTQKSFRKLVYRVLFKLSSQISYVIKN